MPESIFLYFIVHNRSDIRNVTKFDGGWNNVKTGTLGAARWIIRNRPDIML